MAWPEKDARCKRHPRHKQSKGVCPFCLRERLARLTDPSSLSSSSPSAAVADASSSSDSSGSVSSCSSSDVSPPADERLERLKKSKSMAAPFRFGERKGEKKRGFWSKLLVGSSSSSSSERGNDQRVRREGKGAVMSLHSMTMKERSYVHHPCLVNKF